MRTRAMHAEFLSVTQPALVWKSVSATRILHVDGCILNVSYVMRGRSAASQGPANAIVTRSHSKIITMTIDGDAHAKLAHACLRQVDTVVCAGVGDARTIRQCELVTYLACSKVVSQGQRGVDGVDLQSVRVGGEGAYGEAATHRIFNARSREA